MTKAESEGIEVLMGIVRQLFPDEERFDGFAKKFVAAANGRLIKKATKPAPKPRKVELESW